MLLRRVQNKVELGSFRGRLIPLFEEYSKRVLDHEINPVEMFNNYYAHIIFPDCYLFTVSDDERIIGFIGCDLLRGPYYNILYLIDVYYPNGGLDLAQMVENIQNILGANEDWGEASEKVFRVYRRVLGKDKVKRSQFVRMKL
jgi:hypothetical protein